MSYIRGLDIASFAEFQDACMDAITKDGGAVLGIRRLVGIADYKSIFSDCMKSLDVQGINVSYLILHKIIIITHACVQSVSLVRITAKPDGSGVNIYYKDNSVATGWYPRPVQPGNSLACSAAFKPDGSDQGSVMAVEAEALIEKGRRQEWRYDVSFAGGEKKSFILPCKSLPMNINRELVIERLGVIVQQPINPTWFKKRELILKNIKSLLHTRSKSNSIQEWENLFDRLPKQIGEAMTPNFKSSLQILIVGKGGPVQTVPKIVQPTGASVFVDPITFKSLLLFLCVALIIIYVVDGPTQAERIEILKSLNLYQPPKPRKKPAKKKGSTSISADDCSCSSDNDETDASKNLPSNKTKRKSNNSGSNHQQLLLFTFMLLLPLYVYCVGGPPSKKSKQSDVTSKPNDIAKSNVTSKDGKHN